MRRPRYSSSEDEESAEEAKVITLRTRRPVAGAAPARQTRQGEEDEEEPNYGGWVKTAPSKQDQINARPDEIQEKLLNFERIPPEKYKDIEPGTFIRYVRYDRDNMPKLRLGGCMIRNGYPDYWVLKAGGRGRRPITWSVPLKGNPEKGIPSNEYYMKRGILHSRDDRTRYGLEVYEALKSGRYMLIESDRLQALTGELLPGKAEPRQRRPQQGRSRFVLEEAEEEGTSEEEVREPRIRARFRDERQSSSEDGGGWY